MRTPAPASPWASVHAVPELNRHLPSTLRAGLQAF